MDHGYVTAFKGGRQSSTNGIKKKINERGAENTNKNIWQAT